MPRMPDAPAPYPGYWNSNAEPLQPRGDPAVWAERQAVTRHAVQIAATWYNGRPLNLKADPSAWQDPSGQAYWEILDPTLVSRYGQQPLNLRDGATPIPRSAIAQAQYLAGITAAVN